MLEWQIQNGDSEWGTQNQNLKFSTKKGVRKKIIGVFSFIKLQVDGLQFY